MAFSPKYLLFTNIGISVGLSMVGDTMEQSYERLIGSFRIGTERVPLEWAYPGWRWAWCATIGTNIWTTCFPKRTYKVVVVKILLDQFICSPFYIAVFFLTMAILEDNTWEELEQEIREKALVLYAAEWTVWPLAQFINFLLIKPQYRVFYDNTISLGYDIYTSQVKYRKKPEPKDNS